EREVAGQELLRVLLGLVLVDVLLEVLHQADDVAEPEDAAREALRTELLEAVERLAHAEELDGLPGDLLDRQRRAAAGVAVELREDEAVEREAPVELGRGLHRVLADHGVADEEDVVGLDARLDLLELRHERVVDREPAGGVVDDDVVLLLLRLLERAPAELGRLEPRDVEHRDVELLAEDAELIDGGGAVDV